MAPRKKSTEKPAEPEKAPNERVERFTENLPVALTAEQIAERANRSAHKVSDRDHLEEQLKAYTKEEKSKIAHVDAAIRQLSEEVRTRSTYQDVPCERRYNYDTGRVTEVRTDTGAIIHDREMSEREKQRDLDFDKKKDLDDEFADDPQDGDDAPDEEAAE